MRHEVACPSALVPIPGWPAAPGIAATALDDHGSDRRRAPGGGSWRIRSSPCSAGWPSCSASCSRAAPGGGRRTAQPRGGGAGAVHPRRRLDGLSTPVLKHALLTKPGCASPPCSPCRRRQAGPATGSPSPQARARRCLPASVALPHPADEKRFYAPRGWWPSSARWPACRAACQPARRRPAAAGD